MLDQVMNNTPYDKTKYRKDCGMWSLRFRLTVNFSKLPMRLPKEGAWGDGDNLITVAKTCLAQVDLVDSAKPRVGNVQTWGRMRLLD